ncbi:MAG: hypothetical protein ACYTGC_07515 [Planctomycetota bacterium]|jgi:hypothetical protein
MHTHPRSFSIMVAVALLGVFVLPVNADEPDIPIDTCLAVISDVDRPCINFVDDQDEAWFLVNIAFMHPDLGELPFEVGSKFRVTGLYCKSCVQTFCGSFVGFIFDANLVPCVDGDVDADGDVDIDDLLTVLIEWGACPEEPALCPGDADGDHEVDVDDLLMVLRGM